MDKKELRKQVLGKRDALTIEERKEKSNVIMQLIMKHPAFAKADTILLYAAFRSEVETSELFRFALASGKSVYYPKVLGNEMEFYQIESENDFEDGCWGIKEPKVEDSKKYIPKYRENVCVILPGVVFDKDGNRIGYGRGYYDKFLKRMEELDFYKIGVGFACQIVNVESFPREEHDVCLDAIVTEKELYLC